MHNYPECVPSLFIGYYESDLICDEEKDVAHKMIFDERFKFSWSALEKRANQWGIPCFFYQSLTMVIVDALKGPSDWDLLTQKEKETKIDKIKKLARQLSDEINGTPLDEPVTEYFNHKAYFNWFKYKNNDSEAIGKMDYYLERFCEEGDFEFKSKNDFCSVSSAWSVVGVNAPPVSRLIDDLHHKSELFECSSIIKRKKNPNRSFFVRTVSNFLRSLLAPNFML